MTTDGVGVAVVDYARALIAENSTDVVDIPVIFEDRESTASMVIGPASQLMLAPTHVREVTLRDEMTIARLRAKTAALGEHPIAPTDANPSDSVSFDYL